MNLPTALVLAIATFYTGPGRDCRGVPLTRDVARYGDVCARNGVPYGTRLLVSRGGRRVVFTVCDRIGGGSDLDVFSLKSFRRLAGPSAARLGRVRVSVRVVGRMRKGKNRK